jgi:DNA-directed RNA polymerase beta' subunit
MKTLEKTNKVSTRFIDASGARGSKEQIRQLTGMRGLMAKPKKSTAGGGEIVKFFLTLKKVFRS